MIFGTNNALRNFNDIIERVHKFKYLGAIFDPILAWNEHIELYFFNCFKMNWQS